MADEHPSIYSTEFAQVGEISIKLFLSAGEGGMSMDYDLDGVTPEQALGHLMVVTDRIREECKYKWGTCPCCGEPYGSHDLDDDDEYPYD